MRRRDFIRLAGTGVLALISRGYPPLKGELKEKMYGLISKATALPAQRDSLIAILLADVTDMPGCLSYVVAKDPADPNAIWITEVWDSERSHAASLSLPSVKGAITRGKPLIAEFGQRVVTEPIGGYGLGPAKAQ